MATTLLRRETLVAGVAAGLAGAIGLHAFLFLIPWPAVPVPTPAAEYAFIAAGLVGNAATGAPWAVPLGVLIHVTIAIGWAFGYLSAARSRPQLLERPVVSGLVFGLLVWVMMELILLPLGKNPPLTISSVDRDLVSHAFAFGLPLALVAARLTAAAR